LENWPGSHTWQKAAALASEKEPALQSEQADSPASEFVLVPRRQSVQPVEAGAAETRPSGQLRHVLDLLTEAKVPAEQAVQTVAPVPAVKRPGTHEVHPATELLLLKVPASQLEQTVRPTSPPNWPARQGEQALWPLCEVAEPAGHLVH
jgi:hypothetical protein